MTTVGEEKKLNKRLTKDLPGFIQIMNDLKLPYPKQIGEHLVLICDQYFNIEHLHASVFLLGRGIIFTLICMALVGKDVIEWEKHPDVSHVK